jgi:hypothetical protein
MSRLEIYDGTKYIPIPGVPGTQTVAQIGPTPPTARAVGDMWVDTSSPLLEWDDDWTYPAILNGWQEYNTTNYGNIRYRKIAGGMVMVDGMVKNGPLGYNASQAVFMLGVGYRPFRRLVLTGACVNQGDCRLNVDPDGTFSVPTGDPYWVNIHAVFHGDQ